MASNQVSSPSSSKDALLATCHCGRVQVALPSKPTKLNECHCTICYSYGALWGYYLRSEIKIVKGSEQLQSYVREDKDRDMSFERCAFCGNMLLMWGRGEYAGPEHKVGVNCRMLPEGKIEGVEKKISPGPSSNG